MVITPDNPIKVIYESNLTYGSAGSLTNPSDPLHPSKDIAGNPRAQNFVETRTVTYVPVYFLILNLYTRGSTVFVQIPTVKENLAKYTLREEII